MQAGVGFTAFGQLSSHLDVFRVPDMVYWWGIGFHNFRPDEEDGCCTGYHLDK